MKVRKLGILVVAILLASPGYALATTAEAILTINGEYVVSPTDPHSQDGKMVPSIAPAIYVPAEQLKFALDPERFGVPRPVLQKMTFIWDFGDGSKLYKGVNAISRTHAYVKPGLYTVTLTADYRTAGYAEIPPQVIAVADIGIQPQGTSTVDTLDQPNLGTTQAITVKKISVWNQINFLSIAKYSLLIGFFLTFTFWLSVRALQ